VLQICGMFVLQICGMFLQIMLQDCSIRIYSILCLSYLSLSSSCHRVANQAGT
jgi:hypothetical protein